MKLLGMKLIEEITPNGTKWYKLRHSQLKL